MAIKPLHHYSLENPPTIYDEEAMTALKLAGRTAAKVNECVNAFNEHEEIVVDHLNAQDKKIQGLYDVEIPTHVREWLDEHPEATTTVQDRALSIDKMIVGTLGYITPQMFGAKGDGVTNDSKAFADALAFASQHGVTLDVPAGTYLITNITMPSNVTMRGKGPLTVLKQAGTSGQWVNPILINNVYNIIIENLAINGNASEQTYDGKLGIQVLTADNITLRNLVVKNNKGDGISIGFTDYLSTNITIDGCIINSNVRNELVLCHCENVTVRNCVITGGTDTSALVDVEVHANGDYIKDAVFENCTMTQNGQPIKILTNGYTTQFSHIGFNNCRIKSDFDVHQFENLTFNNCVITGGLELSGCKDVLLNHCILSKQGGNALYIYEYETTKPESIRLYGCTIKDSNYGILVSNTDYVTLHGCTIKGCNIGLNIFYENKATTLEACHIYGNTTGILYTGITYTQNRLIGCVLNNTTNLSGMKSSETIIDGFYDNMRFANGEYGFDVTLDSNANLNVPTNLYVNMLGIKKQSASTGWIQNGMIFEDTDGKLKYKSTAGTLTTIT